MNNDGKVYDDRHNELAGGRCDVIDNKRTATRVVDRQIQVLKIADANFTKVASVSHKDGNDRPHAFPEARHSVGGTDRIVTRDGERSTLVADAGWRKLHAERETKIRAYYDRQS